MDRARTLDETTVSLLAPAGRDSIRRQRCPRVRRWRSLLAIAALFGISFAGYASALKLLQTVVKELPLFS